MENKRNNWIIFLILLWAIVLLYMACRFAGLPGETGWPIKVSMGICLLLCVYVTVKEYDGGTLTYDVLVKRILFMGIVMRIGYTLYTGCTVRAHDIWMDTPDVHGHEDYILHLLEYGNLPDSNDVQLYQQPLFYILGATVSKGINAVLGAGSAYELVDAAKVISCLASCCSLFVAKRTLEVCGLKEKGLVRGMILMAFLPAFYLSGGNVTSDMLSGLFLMLAFLFTIYWWKNPSWKHTILLAVIYGFGMMTKVSMGVMAVATAIIFLIALVRALQEHRGKKLVKKYCVFGLISLPLGLWFSVRNYICFGQSLFYIMPLSKTSEIYTGDHSLVERFISLDIGNVLKTPYADAWSDCNLPVYQLKSSLFGEYSFDVGMIVPTLLLLSAAVLAVFCVAAFVKMIRERTWTMPQKFAWMTAIWMYLSSIWFYYRYPFGCSMDYRYLLALTLPVAVVLGSCRFHSQKVELWLDLTCGGFALGSCLMYCLI